MINPFQAMKVISDPAGAMSQALQSQLRSRMGQMAQQNPQAYQKWQEMTSGKSEDDLKQTAMNLAKSQGIDLSQFASQFGIRL